MVAGLLELAYPVFYMERKALAIRLVPVQAVWCFLPDEPLESSADMLEPDRTGTSMVSMLRWLVRGGSDMTSTTAAPHTLLGRSSEAAEKVSKRRAWAPVETMLTCRNGPRPAVRTGRGRATALHASKSTATMQRAGQSGAAGGEERGRGVWGVGKESTGPPLSLSMSQCAAPAQKPH